MKIEDLKRQLDIAINEAYEEGWEDCKENASHLEFSPVRTQYLMDKCAELAKQNRVQESKLRLAVKLIRLAQSSDCGKLGQYDRFFQEGYEEGFEDVYV